MLCVYAKNLNTPDYDGRTALHLACSEGHYEVAVLLLSFDMDLNTRDRFGNTPADDAKAKGHTRIVGLIAAASKPRSAFGGGGECPSSMDDVSSNSSRLTRRTQSLLLSLSKDGTLKCTKADLAMSMFNNGLLHRSLFLFFSFVEKDVFSLFFFSTANAWMQIVGELRTCCMAFLQK